MQKENALLSGQGIWKWEERFGGTVRLAADQGQGVPQGDTQMAARFRKAAEQGYVMAQHMLGYTYRYGLGVTEDYAEACFWFDLAAAGELDASTAKINAENRDEVASHLTPDELARVQELVRKWSRRIRRSHNDTIRLFCPRCRIAKLD